MPKAYWQIKMSPDASKYMGIVTPFKGVRVYARDAMGREGAAKTLDSLLCAVLGDLVQQEKVVRIADDLYVGGISEDDILNNFRLVLEKMDFNNLKLSASKTIICPHSFEIGNQLKRYHHRPFSENFTQKK